MNRAEQEFIARRVADLLAEHVEAPARDGYLSIEHVARRLDVSPRWVRDLLARGLIASYKFEGARRIKVSDVEAYEAAHREEAA